MHLPAMVGLMIEEMIEEGRHRRYKRFTDRVAVVQRTGELFSVVVIDRRDDPLVFRNSCRS